MNGGGTALGILAGGRGERLGGVAKAWLEREGVPQVVRMAQRLQGRVEAVLVSANPVDAAEVQRYAAAELRVVHDLRPGRLGPLAGLEALAQACAQPWLLTVPVDLYDVNDCLLQSLAAAGPDGAVAEDDDGVQPLVALYSTAQLRVAAAQALDRGDYAPRRLQAELGLPRVRLAGVRFGNLNMPADLTAAGVRLPP